MSLEDEIAHLIRQGMQKAGLRKEIEDLKAGNELLDQMLDKEMAKSAYLFECIERLEKAGDSTIDLLGKTDVPYEEYSDAKDKWNAAKKGEPSAWRPIETAPKDGSAVLIYCQVSGAMEAHFEGGEWLDRHNDCREIYVVTHWMPLPNPPSPTL